MERRLTQLAVKVLFDGSMCTVPCTMAAKFGVFVNEDNSKLPMLYWLP